MTSIEKMKERPAQYSSAAIVARRETLLEQTRALIAEKGFEQFNIKDLSTRTGVAKQTIYNIFQTKERMIATAIYAYFEKNEDSIAYHSAPATMERMIERSVVAGTRVQKVPNYMRALMATYHAPDADPDVWDAIHRVGTYAHEAWVRGLAGAGQLQPWIDADVLTNDLAYYRYRILYEWCCGRIAGADVVQREIVGCLSLMSGATRGAARAEIEAVLEHIARDGLPHYPPAPGLDLGALDGKKG